MKITVKLKPGRLYTGEPIAEDIEVLAQALQRTIDGEWDEWGNKSKLPGDESLLLDAISVLKAVKRGLVEGKV